jgi:putative ABC transport system permease protein
MAPWRRGPWLLVRRPGVFLALVAASFVAALPAAAAGPFVSASRHATLRDEIAQSCPSYVGDWITTTAVVPPNANSFGSDEADRAAVADYDKSVKAAAAGQAAAAKVATGLRPLVKTQLVVATLANQTAAIVTDRPGFQQNVTVLSGPRGSGLWIPASYAQDAHLKVGSKVTFGDRIDDRSFPVAAIYRDLRSEPRRPFWCALTKFWNAQSGFESAAPPPLILTDSATFAKTLFASNQPVDLPPIDFNYVSTYYQYLEWDIPTAQPTIAQAKQLVTSINRVNAALGVTQTQPNPTATYLPYYTSDLSDFLPRADLAANVMRPAIAPITGVGIGVGLGVVAAAGVFWVLRRRQELTVLSAHGMSARSLGVKAAIEAGPALILGAAAGWATSLWLVRTAGPSRIIASIAIRESIEAVVATLVGAILVVGFVAAWRARSLADERTRRRLPRVGRLPWELALVVAAPFVWRSYGSSVVTNGNTNGQTAGLVVHVPERLLVVPILAIVGLFIFAARLWAVALRRRRTGSGRTMPRFLAGRRVVREAAVAVVLAIAAALPVSLAVYGAAITNSVQTTLTAKALLYAGSDVVVTLQQPTPIPAEFASHATSVVRLNGVIINGLSTDLLGIDPATFARGAFWNSQITGQSLADIVKPLQSDTGLGPPVAILADASQIGSQELDVEAGHPVLFDVQAISTLPAQHNSFHTALVSQDLVTKAPSAQFQIWIRGDPDTILNEVASSGLRVKYTQVAADTTVNSIYEPLTFTFQYLTALSLLCGVIAIVGLLLYLEARAPGHRRSFVMLHRMGMGTGSHWRAMLWELGTPLIVGLGVGLGASSIAAYTLRSNYDVDPSLPPGGLLTMPTVAMVGISAAVIVVTFVASGYAQLRVVRTNPSNILRDVA